MKKFLAWLLILAALTAAVDGAVAFGLTHPERLAGLPRACTALLRGIYLDAARSIIQFEPEFARYDPGLSYTLKPGAFTFSNAEFRTPYRVNSRGLRAEESDLERPEIVVLGDSRAMGWGVSQEDMYSHVLGRLAGSRTLNAAVSSYGTVREMMLLDRLDLSGVRSLVLHYVDNDYEENAHFYKHANRLKIMDEGRYLEVQKKYLASKTYYFGKYTLFVLYRLGAEVRAGWVRLFGIDELESDVPYFLNALMHARKTSLDGLRLVFLGNGPFIERLKNEIAAGDYPGFIERAVLVSDDVPESGYFVLDNHMNGAGHRLLAERLLPAVK